jgi:hypothetical protein
MPTLMTKETFGELVRIRSALEIGSLAPGAGGRLAGVFVPWAGSRLKEEGGVYYVGMATAGFYIGDDDPPSFDAQLRLAQSCTNNRSLADSPFWQFLDGLTWALLGGPFNETSDRWGWSNLLKIGWSKANPNAQLRNAQREACITSLREEFEKLHDSLIVIVSNDRFKVLDSNDVFPKLVPQWKSDYDGNWNKDYNDETGLYWFEDKRSRNLYVHGYHPRAAARFFGSALGRTIHLARAYSQPFV